MRQISVPTVVDPSPSANLTDLLVDNAIEAPDDVAYSRPTSTGWQDVTWAQFLAEVSALAAGLVASGVQPGDTVGLMSTTRYEWTLTDFAIWSAGAITVPIYDTSCAEQISWILRDCGAVACFTETAAHRATVNDVRDTLPGLRQIWCFDEHAVAELSAAGADVAADELERRRRLLDGQSVATIIYTSGTTGRPKGCELTHANFRELSLNTAAFLAEVITPADACTLLFLPLAHVFARQIQLLCVAGRVRLAHSNSIATLLEDLQQFQPTFILAVPRVFEKIYNSAEATAEAAGKGRAFRTAAAAAVAWSTTGDVDSPVGRGLVLRAQHALFDRLVYAQLRAALGGRVQYAVSGGAPLGSRLGHFFRGAGVTVLEGWGLTETTAPATVNTPEQLKIGTVGRPLPGVSVRVADDGELLVSGINVMRGYHRNPEATARALQDGWLHTGDLGTIDDGGFVQITGRKKEIIVTAGGKNVVPTLLEDRLRAHALISQCIVVGDGRPFIGCLVTLDETVLPSWLAGAGKPPMDVARAAKDPHVRAEIQRAVDHANEVVSIAESIRAFIVLDTDFTEADGQLTPKFSMKRAVILKQFTAAVDELYTPSVAR